MGYQFMRLKPNNNNNKKTFRQQHTVLTIERYLCSALNYPVYKNVLKYLFFLIYKLSLEGLS